MLDSMTDEELEALAAGHELDHTDEDSVAFDSLLPPARPGRRHGVGLHVKALAPGVVVHPPRGLAVAGPGEGDAWARSLDPPTKVLRAPVLLAAPRVAAEHL